MNSATYPKRKWYTAVIGVMHHSNHGTSYVRRSVRGPFATAAETEKAIREFVPAKGEFFEGHVNECEQTGGVDWRNGDAEVIQSYITTIDARDRAAKAA